MNEIYEEFINHTHGKNYPLYLDDLELRLIYSCVKEGMEKAQQDPEDWTQLVLSDILKKADALIKVLEKNAEYEHSIREYAEIYHPDKGTADDLPL